MKPGLEGVQTTGLMTLYGKALDARKPDSILRDTYADQVVRQLDVDWANFRIPPGASITLPIRAKQLDGWTREFLRRHPNATVLHLGCGLDSRVFRVDPPPSVRWYDLDQPAVVDLRRRVYPERESYRMLPCQIDRPDWLEQVRPTEQVLVVAEGLIFYLPEEAGRALLARIAERFPHGELIFDAYSRLLGWLLEHTHAGLRAGIKMGWGIDDPSSLPFPLLESVPFLTYPELTDRLATGWLARRFQRLLGLLPFYRNAIRHLRYRW